MYMRMQPTDAKVKHVISFCKDICVWVTAAAVIMFFLLLLVIEIFPGTSTYVQLVHIYSRKPATFKTDERFLSIGLDCFVIATGFKGFNTSSLKLTMLMKHLSPAYLRIGGNLADRLLFSTDSTGNDKLLDTFYKDVSRESDIDYKLAPNYTMTGEQWLRLMKLANAAQLDVIFGLNALLRQPNGEWDYHNAEVLIEFSQNHSLKLSWELGNEPNAYSHKFNASVSPQQLAKDFYTLKLLLEEYPLYSEAKLFGPDVDRLFTKKNEWYLQTFLGHIGNLVDAATWHQYYVNGRNTTVEEFLDPATFNRLQGQIRTMKTILNTTYLTQKPIWLGETASAYGGGAPRLSNTFIGTFLWIDKLGISAKMGVDVVIRQSIFKEYYALLDEKYNPNPDYWVSILYKGLVGRTVLDYFSVTLPTVRLYAHCASENIPNNPVVVFGSNIGNTTANIRLESSSGAAHTVLTYELTSDSLFSKNVRLNGRLLRLRREYELPKFVPKFSKAEPYVQMPPFSVVFWVIQGLDVQACLA